MKKTKPLVSVIMACYNHDKYVGEAIESVLNQTYDNIEFIVADNGSTDNSYAVIKKYESRIAKIIQLKKNNRTLCGKRLRESANGEYIALMTSDDYWEKEKIELQMKAFEEHAEVKACTTWAVQTDENLQPYSNEKNIFIVENKDRYQWLKHFVFYGNCLALPSAVIEKELYNRLMSSKRGYKQLGDLHDWIRIVQEVDLYVVPQILMKFRWHVNGNNRNESAPTKEANNRLSNEMTNIVSDTLTRIDDSLFIKAFQDEFVYQGAQTHEELLCEKFFLLKRLAEKEQSYEICALNFYYDHFMEFHEVLDSKYRFSYADFHDWSGSVGMRAHTMELVNYANSFIRTTKIRKEQIRGLKKLLFKNVTEYEDVVSLKKELFQLIPQDKMDLFAEVASSYKEIVMYIENGKVENLYESLVEMLDSAMQGVSLLWDELEFIDFPVPKEDVEMYKELINYAKQEKIDLSEAVLPFTKLLQEQFELYNDGVI